MARRDLHRALDEAPEDDARTWKAEIGDEIVGDIVQRDQVANKFKPDLPSERLIVHTDDDEHFTIYCHHIVLLTKVQKLNPQVGDRIAIRRLDDDPDKKYARYKVVVDRAADQATPSLPLGDDDIPF